MEVALSEVKRKRHRHRRGPRKGQSWLKVRFKDGVEVEKHINIHLTLEDQVRAAKLAQRYDRKRMQSIFPLILDYLQLHVHPLTYEVLSDIDKVSKDDYWGTTAENQRPRRLPPNLHRAGRDEAAERTKTFQQEIKHDNILHLRLIALYYKVRVDDLATAAVRTMSAREAKPVGAEQ